MKNTVNKVIINKIFFNLIEAVSVEFIILIVSHIVFLESFQISKKFHRINNYFFFTSTSIRISLTGVVSFTVSGSFRFREFEISLLAGTTMRFTQWIVD